MAKKEIIIYECDLCKKEVENARGLTGIRLPYFENGEHYFMDDYDTSVISSAGIVIDCCDSCTEKIAKLLAKNIGYYDLDKDKLILK